MGQMTFDFEDEDDEPEEPQVEKTKVEKTEIEKPVKETKTKEKSNKKKPKKKTKAHQLAKEQRDIPVSEFFEQNRHILGFDNPTHSLITAVKEGVDNSLDACEQAGILPELKVEIGSLGKDELSIAIEDNGPGIIEENVPNVFGRLLYGSRFGSGKQSRGQQGIGISAAIMYGQLTTGRSATVCTRISEEHLASRITMKLDTRNNRGNVERTEDFVWKDENQEPNEDGIYPEKYHGTRVEFAIKGRYREARPSVLEYLKSTAIVNPHARIIFINPDKKTFLFERGSPELPKLPSQGVKPHPHGVELGQLMRMAHHSKEYQMGKFLRKDLSSMGTKSISDVLIKARLTPYVRPQDITRLEAKALVEAFKTTSIRTPTSGILVPIGPKLIKLGLKQVLEEYRPDFYTLPISRTPSVFSGTPFLVEVGMVYGGNLPKDQPVQVLRFANRVPLLYQAGGCAITKAVQGINWRTYGLEQKKGKGTPNGPAIILVHVASTNIPFTSEAKEAIADIEEIKKEIKLALRNNAKTLSRHLKKQKKRAKVSEKFDLVQKVLPAIAEKTSSVVGKPVPNLDKVVAAIMDVVWIEEEMKFEDNQIEIEIKIINYRLRSANFKLRAEVPGHEIREAEPRPGKREGNHVIWSVGLPTTESAKYKFIIPQGNRSSFEGLELWVEGIDSTNIIGAEKWTGVIDDPGIDEAIEAEKQGLA
ncbi:MAG TPA: DNA topoisomerase VI subunit B [Candidatus Poseidoniia archaeon]|jgi:DNA topoisomerase-6 subunit B|nr:DNA topoisomerase VI subunit B [Candidatus Poseidoniia archaeon]|tara:strand:- start:628 stop:2736 length:2109 start_codon:yes stop_codon:yes gene_type:complete